MNIKHQNKIILNLMSLLMLSGCISMPTYESMNDGDTTQTSISSVQYSIHSGLNDKAPNCLVIMPLAVSPEVLEPITYDNLPGKGSNDAVNADQLVGGIYDQHLDSDDKMQLVRKMLYAHIAPLKPKDIELSHVDRYAHAGNHNPDYKKLSRKLGCHWFLEGELTDFSTRFFGVYSDIVVAADLQIKNAKTGKVLWRGKHEAHSHDGAVPLSPIDLAMGAVKAASNINPEQVERTVSDLSRRLVRTMPLESNNHFLMAARQNQMLHVIANRLNLREGPGQEFSVSKVLKKQEPVAVLDNEKNSQWLLVRTADGVKGYVSGRYVN